MNRLRNFAVTTLVLAPLTVAGCSTIEEYTPDLDWFDDDETAADTQAPGGDREYPSVADTPAELQASAEEERATVAQGLRADNARARYAADSIRRQGDLPEDLPAALAPPSAGAPAPAAAPAMPVARAPMAQAPMAAAAPAPLSTDPAKPAEPTQTAAAPAEVHPMPWLGPRPQPLQVVTSEEQAGAVLPARPGGALEAGYGIYDPMSGGSVVVSSTGVVPAPAMYGSAEATRLGTMSVADRLAPPVPGNAQRIATIQFQNGSARLSGLDRKILAQVVQLHKRQGGVVRVVGHASSRTRDMDPVRHKMVNLDVSVARADAVAKELVRLGAQADRVQTAAVADRDPVFYEVMPSGEAGNRRTEIYFVY